MIIVMSIRILERAGVLVNITPQLLALYISDILFLFIIILSIKRVLKSIKMIDQDLIKILFVITLKTKQLEKKFLHPYKREKLRKEVCSLFYLCKILLKKRKNRVEWVRYIFTAEQRFLQGSSLNLIKDLELYDRQKYLNYLRIDPELFDSLLEKIRPLIEKKDYIREAIPAKTRLQVCLRYLATGHSMVDLSYEFRIGVSTVREIIHNVCDAIWEVLSTEVFVKDNPEEWKKIAREFSEKWNIPHTIGAIDGRHMVIQAPANSGSLYYNYKNDHSIVFLAICDANCKYLMCDIGAPGRRSDGGIFMESEIGRSFIDETLNLPKPSPIVRNGQNIPYFLVGDEGFGLSKYMMRPYARRAKLTMRKKVFNYRLCRARRIIECSFGLLVQRFRIFRRPIIANVYLSIKIVKAAVCLHNLIIDQKPVDIGNEKNLDSMLEDSVNRNFYRDEVDDELDDEEDGNDQEEEEPALKGTAIRNHLAEHFMYNGAVKWQWDKVRNLDY